MNKKEFLEKEEALYEEGKKLLPRDRELHEELDTLHKRLDTIMAQRVDAMVNFYGCRSCCFARQKAIDTSEPCCTFKEKLDHEVRGLEAGLNDETPGCHHHVSGTPILGSRGGLENFVDFLEQLRGVKVVRIGGSPEEEKKPGNQSTH